MDEAKLKLADHSVSFDKDSHVLSELSPKAFIENDFDAVLKRGSLQLRKEIPRTYLGGYKPSAKRTDPVSILEKQGKTRLPQLAPIHYLDLFSKFFKSFRNICGVIDHNISPFAMLPVGIDRIDPPECSLLLHFRGPWKYIFYQV